MIQFILETNGKRICLVSTVAVSHS